MLSNLQVSSQNGLILPIKYWTSSSVLTIDRSSINSHKMELNSLMVADIEFSSSVSSGFWLKSCGIRLYVFWRMKKSLCVLLKSYISKELSIWLTNGAKKWEMIFYDLNQTFSKRSMGFRFQTVLHWQQHWH